MGKNDQLMHCFTHKKLRAMANVCLPWKPKIKHYAELLYRSDTEVSFIDVISLC